MLWLSIWCCTGGIQRGAQGILRSLWCQSYTTTTRCAGVIGGGGGNGVGYGGPNGGYSKGGTIKPTVVCQEKGPCYKKMLGCPARTSKCFTWFSGSMKGSGYGGGAMDAPWTARRHVLHIVKLS
ncbi:unnamed protein product [Fraxinus pennsylvanica]|uniref:Secreted protein n=1 Tax=Fraxinus pennsylvanica TaxID=56036 RepID=A0AAD2AAB2_9LAMI|nr:unnamed protein product [Fraxinus pennsylvanica]